MTLHSKPRVVRRAGLALALLPAALVMTATGPALATAPASWEKPPPVSSLHVLLLLLVAPVALIVVITFLAYVPSLIRGEKYQPGRPWRAEPEWFGGPTGGIAATDSVSRNELEQSSERGGASAHW